MIYSETMLYKIRNYGALKMSGLRMCTILGLEGDERVEFLNDLRDKTSTAYKYYHQGVEIGDYNIDAELAKQAEKGDIDSIVKLEERQHDRGIEDLRQELFGI